MLYKGKRRVNALSFGRAVSGGAGPEFDFPLSTTIVPTKGTGSATFTRATVATVLDWEGKVYNVLSGEVRFQGCRRVRNALPTTSEDFTNAAWTKVTATVTPGIADPLGGVTAYTLTATAPAATLANSPAAATVAGNVHRGSVWMRRRTGVGAINVRIAGVTDVDISASLTAAWQRMGWAGTATDTTLRWQITIATNGDAVDIWHAQAGDATGQANQQPSEYVSVGVLAAPYHGANVDGVKYFQTQNGNVLASNVITEATGDLIPLTGVGQGRIPAGACYFSSPNAVVNQITGDIDLRVYAALDAWTGLGVQSLICKDPGGGDRPYDLFVSNTGNLTFFGTNGATTYNSPSTVAVGFANFTAHWMRVTRDATLGSITFYTSEDGTTWTQLGAVVAGTPGLLSVTGSLLNVGANNNGASGTSKGTFYRAQIYDGINGTLVADFTPTAWTTGATFVSLTSGETWTIQGGAKINKYEVGYNPGPSVVNLTLQSEDYSTTWAAVGTPTRSAAAKLCGNIKLDLIGDDDPAALEGYTQTVAFTGDGVKARSLFFAQGTSTSTLVRILDTTAVANRLVAVITWVNGVPTVTMTTGTLLGVFPKGNGVWRMEVLTTAVTAANVNSIQIYPASDAAAAVGNTGTLYAGGEQSENNTVACNDYMPTTVATATMNRNVLTFPRASNLDDTIGSAYAEVNARAVAGNTAMVVGNNAATGGALLVSNTGDVRVYDGTTFATNGLSLLTLGATAKIASVWRTTTLLMNTAKAGIVGAPVAFDGNLTGAAANLSIGNGAADADSFMGIIRNVRIWKAVLTDGQLASTTA